MATPEQNFQPQVGDTTAGPHIHTYIPRSDGSILVNGVAYIRQSAATIPVVAASLPVAAAAVVVDTPVVQPPYFPYMYPQLYPQLYPQFASLSLPACFPFENALCTNITITSHLPYLHLPPTNISLSRSHHPNQ